MTYTVLRLSDTTFSHALAAAFHEKHPLRRGKAIKPMKLSWETSKENQSIVAHWNVAAK